MLPQRGVRTLCRSRWGNLGPSKGHRGSLLSLLMVAGHSRAQIQRGMAIRDQECGQLHAPPAPPAPLTSLHQGPARGREGGREGGGSGTGSGPAEPSPCPAGSTVPLAPLPRPCTGSLWAAGHRIPAAAAAAWLVFALSCALSPSLARLWGVLLGLALEEEEEEEDELEATPGFSLHSVLALQQRVGHRAQPHTQSHIPPGLAAPSERPQPARGQQERGNP